MKKEKKLTLTQHLVELRQRLIYSIAALLIFFVISYIFVQDIYNFLLQPLIQAYGDHGSQRIIYTGLTEAFITYVKLSFLSALFFSLPIIILQFYLFIAPGLYKSEKKLTLLILLISPLLFLIGAAIAYYFVFPLAFKFFLSFQTAYNIGEAVTNATQVIPIELEARISEYLSLVIQLIFAFGIAFQLPILLVILVKVGIISINSLRSKRKYWILIIFIMAAILTPPDILSQIALALPMLFLYEIAIIIAAKMTKGSITKGKASQ